MGGILEYTRVSTGDQDVAGQRIRLEQAGAIRVYTDVMSGKSMDRLGLAELLGSRAEVTRWRSCGWTASGVHWANC